MIFDKWKRNWQAALAENFFLRFVCLSLTVAVILAILTLKGETRIIVVPPTLTDEFWIEKNKVSDKYLEQMAVFIATLTGNLTPRNAEFNVEALLHYMEDSRVVEVKDDLLAQAAFIRKNNISQIYHADSIKTDIDNQMVTIEGEVTRYIGSIKVSQEKMAVHVGFKIRNYGLKVVDLYVDYPDRMRKKDLKAEDDSAIPPESVGGRKQQ